MVVRCFVNRGLGFCKVCKERLIELAVIGLLLLPVGGVAAAEISTNVEARISNPGFTIVDEGVRGQPLSASGDSVSRQVMTDFEGPILRVESATGVSGNAIGLGGAWAGKTFVNFNDMGGASSSIRIAVGGGSVALRDEIAVTSPTLPEGTPVDVNFSFVAVHSSTLTHTLGLAPNNTSFVSFRFGANIDSPAPGGVVISSADNLYTRSRNMSNSSLPLVSKGIMNPATPQLDVTLNSFVGDTIQLSMLIVATVSGSVVGVDVTPFDGITNPLITSGTGIGALGVAFGATPALPDTNLESQVLGLAAAADPLPDVNLESQLYGGTFPLASMATLANATAAMPEITIPTPSTVSILCIGCGILLSRWRP